ncbi:hypothetical protein [Burkholderia ubonensis]|uniref:hypothetical protein n=1 Tax=Burkholderia ubonensis TaxID=101571 RepID=UPI000B22F273|nr:hypothetical protein [Burkholderia ubonensis]
MPISLNLFTRSSICNIDNFIKRKAHASNNKGLSNKTIGDLYKFAKQSTGKSLADLIKACTTEADKSNNICTKVRFYQISEILEDVSNSKPKTDSSASHPESGRSTVMRSTRDNFLAEPGKKTPPPPGSAKAGPVASKSGKAATPSKVTQTNAPPPPPPPQSAKTDPDASKRVSEKQSGATESSSPVSPKIPHSSDGPGQGGAHNTSILLDDLIQGKKQLRKVEVSVAPPAPEPAKTDPDASKRVGEDQSGATQSNSSVRPKSLPSNNGFEKQLASDFANQAVSKGQGGLRKTGFKLP